MEETVYFAVSNIPHELRASDLRAHFSSLIEGTSFICFHYRHRPQRTEQKSRKGVDSDKTTNKRCCVVKIIKNKSDKLLKLHNNHWTNANGEVLSELCKVKTIAINSKNYNYEDPESVAEDLLLAMPELNPPPLMPNGNVGTPTLVFLDLIQQCLLPQSLVNKLQLKFPKTTAKRIYSNVNFQYGTDEIETSKSGKPRIVDSSSTISRLDKNKMLTPKTYFKDVIKLPSERVSQATNREAANVKQVNTTESSHCKSLDCIDATGRENESHYNHDMSTEMLPPVATSSLRKTLDSLKAPTTVSSLTMLRPSQTLTNRQKKQLLKRERKIIKNLMSEGIEEKLIALEQRYHDEDAAEEWDRHEASEDDPSNQERNKERLYDEEIEMPWEKGGAGVNFYTDAVYWHQQEGDFDEQTTDDLDVDFSAYEEPESGDKDIKDFLKIRQEERFRSGYDSTDRFSIGIGKRIILKDHSDSVEKNLYPVQPIGAFEQYSKGIGRKIMETQGWTEGTGLGRSQHGIKAALKGEGQSAHSKKGLGYVAKRRVYGNLVTKKAKADVHITTVYDNPNETDPKEALLQRAELSTLKHRSSHRNKFKL